MGFWRKLATPALRPLSRRRNRILLYHRVVEDGPGAIPKGAVTRSAFAAQLEYLARFHEVVGLEELLARRDSGRNLVAITFDDGYADNLHVAWPLLRSRQMPATVFVIAGLSGPDQRFPRAPDAPLLSREELRRIDREGLRVEAHTVSHPRLSELDKDEVAREIGESKAMLEELLGRPLAYLAYPFGERPDFGESAKRAAREAGFEAAFTAYRGVVHGGTDLFAVPRIPTNQDLDRFKGRLARY